MLRTSRRSLLTRMRWTLMAAGLRIKRCWPRQSAAQRLLGSAMGRWHQSTRTGVLSSESPLLYPLTPRWRQLQRRRPREWLPVRPRVGTTVRARLAFEDVNGFMRAETVEALLERVQYRPPGSEAASFIVSFTVFEGEMYEVAYLEANLDACVAAAEPAPPSPPPVVVIGAEYGRTLAVLGRVSLSATLLAAEPRKVCSAELQQLAEALAVPAVGGLGFSPMWGWAYCLRLGRMQCLLSLSCWRWR